jgi:hypothetical protein
MAYRACGFGLILLLVCSSLVRADRYSYRPDYRYCLPTIAYQSNPIATPAPPLWNPAARLVSGWAQPVAAPPSGGPSSVEPPLAGGSREPKAAVSESPSYYDSYAVAPRRGQTVTGDRCSLNLWNLSNQQLSVKVDGQTKIVARGKNVALEVPREFVWQVEGRAAQTERIAAGEWSLMIVIRR